MRSQATPVDNRRCNPMPDIAMRDQTSQYSSIQRSPIQDSTRRAATRQGTLAQHTTPQYRMRSHQTTQLDARQHNAVILNAAQCNAMQHTAIQLAHPTTQRGTWVGNAILFTATPTHLSQCYTRQWNTTHAGRANTRQPNAIGCNATQRYRARGKPRRDKTRRRNAPPSHVIQGDAIQA